MFRLDIKHLAAICAALGVRRAVIAPGSRNTPLTLALTAQPGIACFPVTDERSAGFFALGMAQYSREPVALVCTSGSAVLNFAPAVVEAYYQNLPLIVITADRPSEWIDQSDGQTIRQQNIYANYIKGSFQLPTDRDREPAQVGNGVSSSAATAAFSDRIVAQAIDTALQFPRGPVHINVPLSEPLYVDMPGHTPPPRILRTLATDTLPSAETAGLFVSSWNKASKRMIVVGTGHPDEAVNSLLNAIADTTETLVIAENLSNINGPGIVSTPDLFFAALTEDEKAALRPDMLVTIGHSVVSKQLKIYLRTYQPAEHWQLQTELPYADTYRALTHIVPVKGSRLLELVLPGRGRDVGPSFVTEEKLPEVMSGATRTYRSLVSSVSGRIRTLSSAYFRRLPHCDIAVLRDLLPLVPPGWVVQLANSTPVRISQFFDTRADLRYFCNRGTSGIEGSVATAAGSALASGLPTLFISGDLSFLYDSNGLWNTNFPSNLKIVVLNNEGANIFSMIGDQQVIERCQPFFDASHSVDLEVLCKAYGIEYRRFSGEPATPDPEPIHAMQSRAAATALQTFAGFLALPGAAVLEVRTDRAINVSSYKQLFKTLQ